VSQLSYSNALQQLPVIDPTTQLVTRGWWMFFTTLATRVGGLEAPTNDELLALLLLAPPDGLAQLQAGLDAASQLELLAL
jgi:hypothetical protein